MTSYKWDFAVVGGGIAGLAIAELLQRSGATVILLEKDARLCAGASAEQQGWFHTGALYTALPTNYYCRTMVGNLDDLVDYYLGFPNMNLRVGKHISTARVEGWFANRTNFYVYEHWRDVGWARKLPWAAALARARRRMSWFENLDVSRSLSPQISFRTKPTKFVEHHVPMGVNLGQPAFVLKSRDRAMDTALIASDLARSFLASGGTIRCQTEVVEIRKNQVRTCDHRTGMEDTLRAGHVIVTTGRATGVFGIRTKVMVSPLLVTVPALADMNFVRMSPHFDRTLNHIVHRTDGVRYSVVGNAVYYPAGSDPALLAEAEARMIKMTSSVFGELGRLKMRVFFGYKTEIVASSQMRNYLYHIVETDTHTVALPGKFSLCFSLAVNVCRRFGVDPIERVVLAPDADVRHLISEPRHCTIAQRLWMPGAPLAASGSSPGALAGAVVHAT